MYALILVAGLGPGSEVTADCGYWTHPATDATGKPIPERKWVPIIRELVLVGFEDEKEAASIGRKPMYVFARKDARRLRGQSEILSLDQIGAAKVTRLTPGELPIIEWSELEVGIRR